MMKKIKIRIGSRSSALALAQTQIVMDAIVAAYPELELVLVPMSTTGDRNMKTFADISDPRGIKGLFTLELERALLSGEIDLAVHSLKDVPMILDERLPIVAYSHREDPRDAIVLPLRENKNLEGEYTGAISCSSLRRRLQLEKLFPGREVVPVRGNVQTRLRKLDHGEFDTPVAMTVLAAAGLKRLGLANRISKLLSIDEMLPAPGQGTLACQGRADENYFYLDAVRDRDVEDCSRAERNFAAALGGGCTQPVAAYAVIDIAHESRSANKEILRLTGLYIRDGKFYKGVISGPREDAGELGRELARKLIGGFSS